MSADTERRHIEHALRTTAIYRRDERIAVPGIDAGIVIAETTGTRSDTIRISLTETAHIAHQALTTARAGTPNTDEVDALAAVISEAIFSHDYITQQREASERLGRPALVDVRGIQARRAASAVLKHLRSQQ